MFDYDFALFLNLNMYHKFIKPYIWYLSLQSRFLVVLGTYLTDQIRSFSSQVHIYRAPQKIETIINSFGIHFV